jgi:Protein of unknown function (DUF3618)
MPNSPSNIRREIAHTRERMTETIDQIDSQVSERVSAAKHKMDVMQFAREHPWPALSVAIAIGAFVGGSGADEKAAAATAQGAKRAAGASGDTAKRLVAKVRDRHQSPPERDTSTRDSRNTTEPGAGLADKLFAAASAPLAGVIDRVLDEMRAASRDLGSRLAGSGRSTPRRPTSTVTAVELVVEARPQPPVPRAEDVVPVPSEMLPTEVDARVDAVEALGGGTHEPPLEPGAGDLGARWA